MMLSQLPHSTLIHDILNTLACEMMSNIRLYITVITQVLFHCVNLHTKQGDLLNICMSLMSVMDLSALFQTKAYRGLCICCCVSV